MALCGAGFGLFQSPNNHTIISSALHNRSGGASGMLGTARLLGQSSGAALVALMFNNVRSERHARLADSGGTLLQRCCTIQPVAPVAEARHGAVIKKATPWSRLFTSLTIISNTARYAALRYACPAADVT